jgi:hypothetical protein
MNSCGSWGRILEKCNHSKNFSHPISKSSGREGSIVLWRFAPQKELAKLNKKIDHTDCSLLAPFRDSDSKTTIIGL